MRTSLLLATLALSVAPALGEEAGLLDRLGNAPQIGTEDRYVRFSPFVQFDGAFTQTSPATLRPAGEGREGDIRRARLYTDFQYDALGGRVALDFGEFTDAPFHDTYLDYRWSENTLVRAGQQDIPFSMQVLTGSRSALFAEDGPNEVFGLDDAVGAALWTGGDAWSLGLGVYGGNINEQPFDDGVLLAARATKAESLGAAGLLHFGLGLAAGFDRQEELSFAGRVGTDLSTIVPIETDPFEGSAETLAANAEFAALLGRVTIQSEYTLQNVDARVGGSATLHGGYGGALLFLTDDRRKYDAGAGEFSQVEPERSLADGGLGAFEIGARLEFLDLSAVPDGGRTLAGTAIANWYPTDILRFTATHTLTEVTSGPDRGERINATLLRASIIY